MKKLILIFSLTTCFSMAAQFSPVKDPRGFIGGYFKGQNCVFTNVSLNLANGTTYGVFDEFGGFIFTDYAGNQRFVWDPSSDDWSFIATNGTVKLEVDHNSKLTLNNPFLVGTVTGNGLGLSNAVDLIAGSNITIVTNANKRSYTISASAGAGSGTFDYAQLTNVPVRIGTLATNNAAQALTNLMSSISINSIPVETANGGLITTAATITGSGGDTLTVPFLVGSTALDVGTNSIRNSGSSINGIGFTNSSLTVPGNINVAGTFNVGALNATNFSIAGQSNGVAVINSDSSVTASNSITLSSANPVLFITNTANGSWLRYTNSTLTIGASNTTAGISIFGTSSAGVIDAPGGFRGGSGNTYVNHSGSTFMLGQSGSWNTFHFGADSATTPVLLTLNGPDSTGSNNDGTDLTWKAPNGTGTGGGGRLIWATAGPAASGSTANTFTNQMFLGTNGYLSLTAGLLATNGLASFSPIASVAIDSTGWTNIWSTNNAVVVFGGTTVSSWKKRAGALTATNITYPVFTGNSTVILQPGQALVISGTGVTGSADPF